MQVDRGNGVSTTFTYDVRGRATNLLTQATVNGQLVKHQDVKYSYNTNNSIATIVNNPTTEDTGIVSAAFESRYEYTYDGLNRLVEANGSYGSAGFVNADPLDAGNKKFHRRYAYAKNGNLTQKQFVDPETLGATDTWNYSYTNHRVDSITSTAFGGQKFSLSYDENGNTLSKVDNDIALTKDMSYDWANRITKVVNPTTGETMGRYEYDDQGFRVRRVASKVIDGTPEEIVLTTANKYFVMERRRNASGQDIPGTDVAINNVYLNGKRIASMDASAKTYFYLADNVDSVKVVTNDIGEAVSRTEYLPYGETFATENQTQPPICVTDPTDPSCKVFAMVPKYNGQSLDPETMLYFYNARHYDPEIARFVTADTVLDGGASATAGWNRYMYVHGNPIMYKDPTGHRSEPQMYGKQVGKDNYDKDSKTLTRQYQNKKGEKFYVVKQFTRKNKPRNGSLQRTKWNDLAPTASPHADDINVKQVFKVKDGHKVLIREEIQNFYNHKSDPLRPSKVERNGYTSCSSEDTCKGKEKLKAPIYIAFRGNKASKVAEVGADGKTREVKLAAGELQYYEKYDAISGDFISTHSRDFQLIGNNNPHDSAKFNSKDNPDTAIRGGSGGRQGIHDWQLYSPGNPATQFKPKKQYDAKYRGNSNNW